MKTHEFITTMRDDLHCQEDSTILAWLAFTGEVADNTESDYENELDETMRALCFVKNNFNAEVLQKALAFKHWQTRLFMEPLCFTQALRRKRLEITR